MEEMGHAYVFLVARPVQKKKKRPVVEGGGALRRWEDMIERDVKDIEYEDMGWVNRPAEGGGAPLGMAINLRAPLKHRNLQSSYQCCKGFDPSS